MTQVSARLDVLRSIDYFCTKFGGKTRASAKAIAERAKVNRDTIFASLPELERAGYVKVTRTADEKGVKINWYEVLPAGHDVLANLEGGSRNQGSRRSDRVVGIPNSDSVVPELPEVPSSSGTTRTGTTTTESEIPESPSLRFADSAPAPDREAPAHFPLGSVSIPWFTSCPKNCVYCGKAVTYGQDGRWQGLGNGRYIAFHDACRNSLDAEVGDAAVRDDGLCVDCGIPLWEVERQNIKHRRTGMQHRSGVHPIRWSHFEGSNRYCPEKLRSPIPQAA